MNITIKERGTLNSFSITVNRRSKKLSKFNLLLSSCTAETIAETIHKETSIVASDRAAK